MNWFMFGLGIGVFIFFIFMAIYSDIKERKKGVQIEMIRARLLLLSSDPKAIEEFLVVKESSLTKEMIDDLINRVVEIKAEEVIDKDWANKAKQVEKVQ